MLQPTGGLKLLCEESAMAVSTLLQHSSHVLPSAELKHTTNLNAMSDQTATLQLLA